VAENPNISRTGQAHAYHALATVFAQGFRFLATINGLGVLLTLFCAVGVFQTNVAPDLFRMPLALFIGGLCLCGVGLLWSYLVQTCLFSQLIEGRHRRTHWVPMVCTMLAYSLSLIVFAVGCWYALGLANLAYHDSAYSQSYDQDDGPSSFDQSDQSFMYQGAATQGVVLRAKER